MKSSFLNGPVSWPAMGTGQIFLYLFLIGDHQVYLWKIWTSVFHSSKCIKTENSYFTVLHSVNLVIFFYKYPLLHQEYALLSNFVSLQKCHEMAWRVWRTWWEVLVVFSEYEYVFFSFMPADHKSVWIKQLNVPISSCQITSSLEICHS